MPTATIASTSTIPDPAALRRRAAPAIVAVTAALLAALVTHVPPPPPARNAGREVSVIVQAVPGAAVAAERAVEALGGEVTRRLGIIHGFVADVPVGAPPKLESLASVRHVSPNRRIVMSHLVDGFNAADDIGSMFNLTKISKVQDAWKLGITGKGVDVALIDTGVVPVNGLTTGGKVINGPDLSFESQVDELRYLDTFGHGTHMAGIMVGRDDNSTALDHLTKHDRFAGVAPDARVLSLKVADAEGQSDVSQVIAAIDWVVQHRNDNGMNIRVLNLSFGTDSSQDYREDPLAHAAEVAWHKGIVVVASAGNQQFGDGRLNDPAYDPYLIAVGAHDPKGTASTSDDSIPSWSSRGDGVRNPDLVAPGKSVVSLRDPQSWVDQEYPQGRVGSRFFRGSGTSQSGAVVSGAAALLLQQRPHLTPDQVKALLRNTAVPIPGVATTAQGAGALNVKGAIGARTPVALQAWDRSMGEGSIELARGSLRVKSPDLTLVDGTVLPGVEIGGEFDIFSLPWRGRVWADLSIAGTSWSGGVWNGSVWTGACWCAESWSGASWSGQRWSGTDWAGESWSSQRWSQRWSGQRWSGQRWSGQRWSSDSWQGQRWSSQRWSGETWG